MGKRGTFFLVAAAVLVAIVLLYRKSVAQSKAAASASAGGLIGSVNSVYKTTDRVLGDNFGTVGKVGAITRPRM